VSRIQFIFLRSRVARRVFLLFILSALVPVVMLVLLALGHLGGLLEDVAYRELAHAGKSYGMALFERLAALEDETASAVESAGRPRRAMYSDCTSGWVRAIRVASADELETLAPEARRRLLAGGTVIVTGAQGRSGASVIILRAADPARRARILAVEPDPTCLWGEPDALAYLTDVCVLDSQGAALFCPRLPPASARAAVTGRTDGTTRHAWRDDGQEFIASHWTQFLGGKFAAPSWTVVASRPRAAALAPLRTFWTVAVPAIVVALLLVTLLTVVQVRRRLVPIELLTDATRRIGNQDFATRVTVRTADEFEELAHALNSMSERLGRQFFALATWSETDRVILAEPDVDRVLRIVLSRLPRMLPADVFSVTILEDANSGDGHTYVSSATADSRVTVAPPRSLRPTRTHWCRTPKPECSTTAVRSRPRWACWRARARRPHMRCRWSSRGRSLR
jgi:HAMP domain-containing protein